MEPVIRWFSRVTFGIAVFIGVTAAIDCVVSIATGDWSAVPGSLIFVLAVGYMLTVRFRRRTLGRPRAADRSGTDGITSLRSLTATFAVALLLFGVVIAQYSDLPNGPVIPWIPLLVALTLMCFSSTRLEKPLDCTSPTQLAGSYRTRFFVRLAFAECPALFAFCFVFIGAPTWTYYLGMAFSLIRIATNVAPTRAALARDQAALDANGCRYSLVDALAGAPAI